MALDSAPFDTPACQHEHAPLQLKKHALHDIEAIERAAPIAPVDITQRIAHYQPSPLSLKLQKQNNLRDVFIIGNGGAIAGLKCLYHSYKQTQPFKQHSPRFHFLEFYSEGDCAQLYSRCTAANSAAIVISQSFSGSNVIAHIASVKAFFTGHKCKHVPLYALSNNSLAAQKAGIAQDNLFCSSGPQGRFSSFASALDLLDILETSLALSTLQTLEPHDAYISQCAFEAAAFYSAHKVQALQCIIGDYEQLHLSDFIRIILAESLAGKRSDAPIILSGFIEQMEHGELQQSLSNQHMWHLLIGDEHKLRQLATQLASQGRSYCQLELKHSGLTCSAALIRFFEYFCLHLAQALTQNPFSNIELDEFKASIK